MSDGTGIGWTSATWPVVVGCEAVSPGCDNCYAAVLTSGRLKHQPAYAGLAEGGKFTGEVRLLPDRLDWPLRWRKPRRIFVCSMSDLLHKDVPDDYVAKVFAVMALAPQHTFQVLTKRHARLRSLLSALGFRRAVQRYALERAGGKAPWLVDPWWPLRNVWVGVSVENQQWADIRVPALLDTPAAVRFLSCEPLLGPVDLSTWTDAHAPWNYTEFGVECSCGAAIVDERERCNGDRISWVIAGGESGPRHRPVDLDWFRTIRDQCTEAGVAFFLKQIGGRTPKANGNVLDGQVWEQFPDDVKAGV